MSETPSEPATAPVAAAPQHDVTPVRDEARRSRLGAAAAWVGIAAGVVFIVAVIFFSGFVLGAHSGGHHRGGFLGGHDRGTAIFHRGPPPMGPRAEFERPPFGGPGMPGGPRFQPPQSPQSPEAPTTTAPARP